MDTMGDSKDSRTAPSVAPSSHTPGPWRPFVMTHHERGDLLTPDELGEYVKNSVLKSAAKSGSTEFVFVSAQKPDGDADVCHVGNGPTRAANARLIAAAPDLFNIARTIVAICDSGDENMARLACTDTSPLVGECRELIRRVAGTVLPEDGRGKLLTMDERSPRRRTSHD